VPAFKLDQSVVQRRIDLLRKCGVVFRLGLNLWDDLSLTQLKSEFNAVFLALDWRKSRSLDVPGADFKGVVQAVPFLLQKKTPIQLELPHFDVSGKRVVVLGAGDTAMDCLRAAIRYGAREAVCVYRREESEMPCSHHEYKSAVEEGAQFVFRSAPVAVLSDETGQVTGLRASRTEPGPIDAIGRQSFLLKSGTEFRIEADWIIAALGFEHLACPHTDELKDLALNDWGGFAVDGNQMTSITGVFAGGDIVHGPSPLLHAVRDARLAARNIHQYLSPGIADRTRVTR
jgi:glutamate synthase (NADPH/NADH) small chain